MEAGRKEIGKMVKVDNIYIIDACALIAFLNKEDGAKIVEQLLEMADGNYSFLMHKINMLECYYDHQKNPAAPKTDFYEIMANLPIELIDDLDKPLFDKILQLKSSFRISLADSFVLATAITHNATVITSDHHEMDIVEKSGLIKFLWIR